MSFEHPSIISVFEISRIHMGGTTRLDLRPTGSDY